MNCEYVREYYKVPAKIGLRIKYKEEYGTIYKDGGNYISVNFDKDKPAVCSNIHPLDPNLRYLTEIVKLRKLTRSQQRYRDYLESEYAGTFAEYIGCDYKTMQWKKRMGLSK